MPQFQVEELARGEGWGERGCCARSKPSPLHSETSSLRHWLSPQLPDALARVWCASPPSSATLSIGILGQCRPLYSFFTSLFCFCPSLRATCRDVWLCRSRLSRPPNCFDGASSDWKGKRRTCTHVHFFTDSERNNISLLEVIAPSRSLI